MNNVRGNVQSCNDEPDSKIGTNTLPITCLPAGSRSIEKAISPMKECFFSSSLFITRNSEMMWTVSGSPPSRRENIQAGWVAAQGILLAARSDAVSVGGPNLWNSAALGSMYSSFRSLAINGDGSRKTRTLQNSYRQRHCLGTKVLFYLFRVRSIYFKKDMQDISCYLTFSIENARNIKWYAKQRKLKTIGRLVKPSVMTQSKVIRQHYALRCRQWYNG